MGMGGNGNGSDAMGVGGSGNLKTHSRTPLVGMELKTMGTGGDGCNFCPRAHLYNRSGNVKQQVNSLDSSYHKLVQRSCFRIVVRLEFHIVEYC